MPASYFTMWGTLILMAFGALAGGIFHGNLLGSVRGAYPAETARQIALRRCGRMDPEFSRFSERDREICYRAVIPASAQSTPPAGFGR